MTRQQAILIPVMRDTECGFEDEPGGICPYPAQYRVLIDVMYSEDIPARYPPGSERPGQRTVTHACHTHAATLPGIELF